MQPKQRANHDALPVPYLRSVVDTPTLAAARQRRHAPALAGGRGAGSRAALVKEPWRQQTQRVLQHVAAADVPLRMSTPGGQTTPTPAPTPTPTPTPPHPPPHPTHLRLAQHQVEGGGGHAAAVLLGGGGRGVQHTLHPLPRLGGDEDDVGPVDRAQLRGAAGSGDEGGKGR